MEQLEPYMDKSPEMPTLDERILGNRPNFTGTREQTFMMSKNINEQLNDIETKINVITKNLSDSEKNTASGESKQNESLELILNTYYEVMKRIENSAKETKQKISEIEATYNLFKY